MKLYLNYKIWLFVLIFLSSWIILSIELEILPLFPINISISLVNKINNILLAISYSIIAAYIFFWFTSILPEKIIISKSKNILSRDVHDLIYELFLLLSQILNLYNIEKELEKIQEKDLLHINGKKLPEKDIMYATSLHWRSYLKKRKQFTGFSNMTFKSPESLIQGLEKITIKIENIRKSNPNFTQDTNFAEILSAIETNRIISWSKEKYNLFIFANSSEFLYKLIYDYRRLVKLRYHLKHLNSFNKIRFYSEKEIQDIKSQPYKNTTEIQLEQLKLKQLKPILICSSNYKENRVFMSRIRFPGLFYYENINDSILKDSKCIIIVEKKLDKKEITNFIKNNIETKIIILLKANKFKSNINDSFNNKALTNGLYNFSYRESFKVFGYEFNSKFPSKNETSLINKIIVDILYSYVKSNIIRKGNK